MVQRFGGLDENDLVVLQWVDDLFNKGKVPIPFTLPPQDEAFSGSPPVQSPSPSKRLMNKPKVDDDMFESVFGLGLCLRSFRLSLLLLLNASCGSGVKDLTSQFWGSKLPYLVIHPIVYILPVSSKPRS